jgi:hypothetical protein
VFPYQKGSGEDARNGYVWVTEWDSEADAEEFAEAYGEILVAQGVPRAEIEDGDTIEGEYVIPTGEYADAFRIDREGTRVTIVNAPTAEQLSEIRPPGASDGAGADTGGDSDGNAEGTTASADGDSESGSTGLEAPGFGPLTAVLALIAAVALAAVARRLD